MKIYLCVYRSNKYVHISNQIKRKLINKLLMDRSMSEDCKISNQKVGYNIVRENYRTLNLITISCTRIIAKLQPVDNEFE